MFKWLKRELAIRRLDKYKKKLDNQIYKIFLNLPIDKWVRRKRNGSNFWCQEYKGCEFLCMDFYTFGCENFYFEILGFDENALENIVLVSGFVYDNKLIDTLKFNEKNEELLKRIEAKEEFLKAIVE